MTTGALDQGLIEFLILLMSRSMDPIVFANSTMALATSSIFWSVVLFGLSADLAKDSADELLNGVLPPYADTMHILLAGYYCLQVGGACGVLPLSSGFLRNVPCAGFAL